MHMPIATPRVSLATIIALLLLVTAALPVGAQESQLASDLRREADHVKESCSSVSPKSLGGCVYTLATDYPFHVALGSLPPQNGFATGLAFSERYTPNESWRLTWSADAVRAFGGSYRAGAYMKLVHTPGLGITVRRPGSPTSSSSSDAERAVSAIDLFAQTISLNTIGYFGEGERSAESDHAFFGERQTMIGASAAYPLSHVPVMRALRAAVVGGVTGRFITIRPGRADDGPSIEQRYTGPTAPGLDAQDPFVELREGLRLAPSVGRVQFDYAATLQQFRTSASTRSSFNRWSIDLDHQIPLYRGVSTTGARAFNSPNECAASAGTPACPPLQWSRNRQGSIGLRLLLVGSSAGDGNAVPFYLQPTLGGSDLNGERLLAAYDDYRFRAPNVIALQESIEHSLWGPVGVFAILEQGKVAERQGDLDFSGMKHSTSVGLTLRAGGFPMVNLSFAWGSEGHHIIGAMNTSLLGGSARPSNY